MNLLCPNCNKMLTVPEQYAGQLMKCPLCTGTFTVPNVPAFGGPELAPAFDAPPPPPAPAPALIDPTAEPIPAFQAPPPPAPPPPAPPPAPAEPAFAVSAPPPVAPPPVAPPPRPAPPPAVSTAPTPPPAPPAGYTTRLSIVLNDKVLQWVPPACIVVIFLLTFFSWVGVYPGGVPAATQSAWGAAFGGYTQDMDMKEIFYFPTQKELDEKNAKRREDKKEELKNYAPGWAVLVLFYLLPFLLLTLVVSIAVAALPFVTVALPPAVQQFLPWRWAILFGLNALLLLFLFMQLLLGFPIESNMKERVMDNPQVKKPAEKTEEIKRREATIGAELAELRRTFVLRLVVLLHIVATVCAGLVYWIERRGPGRPLPRVDAMW